MADQDNDLGPPPLPRPKYYPETERFGCVLVFFTPQDCDGPDAGEGMSPALASTLRELAALNPDELRGDDDCDDRDEADRWCQGCGDERDEDGGCPTVGCDHGEDWDDDCDGPDTDADTDDGTDPPPCQLCALGLCSWHGDAPEDCDGPGDEPGFLDSILRGSEP